LIRCDVILCMWKDEKSSPPESLRARAYSSVFYIQRGHYSFQNLPIIILNRRIYL